MPDEFVDSILAAFLMKYVGSLASPHFGQVGSIGGIVTADNQQQIQRVAQKASQARPADPGSRRRIVSKKRKCLSFSASPYSGHGATQPPLDLFSFSAQHGRLVGHRDSAQINVRIEPFRVAPLNFSRNSALFPPFYDVIADVIGFGQSKIRPGNGHRHWPEPGNWWLWFLMPGFSVNDARDRIF